MTGLLHRGIAVRSAVIAAFLLQAAPHVAHAQQGATPEAAPPPRDCLSSIPASAMTRVAVFAAPSVHDSAHRAILPQAAALVQDITDRARSLLGGAGSLPEGEPSITWRELDASLLVTGYRDGHVSWRVQLDSAGMEWRGDAGARLMARALEAAHADGEAILSWPESLPGDSATFRVDLVRPVIDAAGKVQPVRAALAIPLLTVAAPRESPVVLRRAPRVSYPGRARDASAVGVVILRFVVDTAGRPDVSTVHDLWPANRPRLTGEMGRYYDQFLAAVRTGIAESRFEPARAGGCAVRQGVEQPFEFILR